jgi:hypothetical protein
MPSLRGVTFVAAALLVTAYGGLLRFEALNGHYGWMGQPAWSASLARLWYVRLEPAGSTLTAVR